MAIPAASKSWFSVSTSAGYDSTSTLGILLWDVISGIGVDLFGVIVYNEVFKQ
jgi:hypothetical protein